MKEMSTIHKKDSWNSEANFLIGEMFHKGEVFLTGDVFLTGEQKSSKKWDVTSNWRGPSLLFNSVPKCGSVPQRRTFLQKEWVIQRGQTPTVKKKKFFIGMESSNRIGTLGGISFQTGMGFSKEMGSSKVLVEREFDHKFILILCLE